MIISNFKYSSEIYDKYLKVYLDNNEKSIDDQLRLIKIKFINTLKFYSLFILNQVKGGSNNEEEFIPLDENSNDNDNSVNSTLLANLIQNYSKTATNYFTSSYQSSQNQRSSMRNRKLNNNSNNDNSSNSNYSSDNNDKDKGFESIKKSELKNFNDNHSDKDKDNDNDNDNDISRSASNSWFNFNYL